MKILIEHNCEIKITFDRWTVPSEWNSVAFSMVDEAVLFFVCPLCKHETKPQLPKKIYSRIIFLEDALLHSYVNWWKI